MNQNYTFVCVCQTIKKLYVLVCRKTLVISLCVCHEVRGVDDRRSGHMKALCSVFCAPAWSWVPLGAIILCLSFLV